MIKGTVLISTCFLASPVVAEITCGKAPFENDQRLTDIYRSLRHATQDFAALNDLLENKVSLCISDTLRDAVGYLEPETQQIVFAAGLSTGMIQAVGVHELRHAQQYADGLCPKMNLSMKEFAEGVFAMEADASVTSLVVATRLRNHDTPEMWNALAHWPMQYDIAATFDRVLQSTSDMRLAASGAFSQWYTNPIRVTAYYTGACMEYLDQMDREKLLPRYESLEDGFYDALCYLPNGESYPCAKPECSTCQ